MAPHPPQSPARKSRCPRRRLDDGQLAVAHRAASRTVAAASDHIALRQPRLVPALIALCENRRLLLRRPRAPSARSGEDLKPSNRLTLRLVQKLSVRHVSNPLPTQTTSDNRPLANAT